MSHDVTFNTGRGYTARGQVIRAIETPDGAIFSDFSRCICGAVKIPPCADPRDFARAVLAAYDACQYRYDFDAANIRDNGVSTEI